MEKIKTRKKGSKGKLAILRLPVLAVACCGLPIILSVIGLTTLGAFLTGKEVWIFGGLLMVAGMGMLIRKMVNRGSCTSD